MINWEAGVALALPCANPAAVYKLGTTLGRQVVLRPKGIAYAAGG